MFELIGIFVVFGWLLRIMFWSTLCVGLKLCKPKVQAPYFCNRCGKRSYKAICC